VKMKYLSSAIAVALFTALLALVSCAGCASTRGVPASHATANLDHVDGLLWRSGQPSRLTLEFLKAHGVRTVIDLRDDSLESERLNCHALGMLHLRVPMKGTGRPDADRVRLAVALAEKAGGPVLVHCQFGADRTGVVVAEWRKRRGMTPGDALREAEAYGLSPWLPVFRSFILRELPR